MRYLVSWCFISKQDAQEACSSLQDPDGEEFFEDSQEPVSDGSFEFLFTLDDDAPAGQYDVTLSYSDPDNDKVLTFNVTTEHPSYPTLDPSDFRELTNGSISNSYGIIVEFVQSDSGYLGGGVPPVGPDGEEPAPEPNALLLSSDNSVWHHRIILCGPDDICIDDGGGGGLVSGSEGDAGLYQFYPLNEVSWGLGDLVHIWMLVSDTAPNGEPIGTSQWVDIGDIPIEECASELWCPANTNHV